MDGLGGFITVIAIFVLYFLPTIIVATKMHPEKTLIVALNFFLGWTVICWFIALYMALSRRGLEQMQAHQAITVDALKGQYESEIKELRRKNRELYSAQRPQRMAETTSQRDTELSQRESELSNREAELADLKSEYEERLRALSEERQQAASQPQPEVAATPRPEAQPNPVAESSSAPSEYEGEPLYVVVPSQFERVVAETLSRRFTDQEVEAADDGSRGIDLQLFESGGDRSRPSAIVQCKLQSHDDAVEYRAVSDLLGSMSLHGAERAYLVTTGSFSDDAQQMITSGTMKDRLVLIDGMTFNQWRTQAGLAPVHYLSLAG